MRHGIVAAVERGTSKSETARTFRVSLSSVKRYLKLAAHNEPLTPRKGGGRPPKINATIASLLEEDVNRRPYAAVWERASFLPERERSKALCVHRKEASSQAWVLPQKRSVGASERDEFLRAAWRAEISGRLEANRFVFVDETGTNTSLSPLYGWSRVGERLRTKAPRNWGKNVTLISSITTEGMEPSVAVEGPTTREVFELYVEKVLAVHLCPGEVVVMDNLSSHKNQRVRRLIEECGCELIYLPPYSPDLNPIEEAFSKVKDILRKAQARTHDALIEAMGRALGAVSPSDARGFFEHSGYRAATVQPF